MLIPPPSRNPAQLASSGENASLVGMGVGPSRPGCGSPGTLSFRLVGGCELWLPPPGTCHLPCPFVPCPFTRENRPSPSVTLTFPLHPHLWLLIWDSSLGESFSAVSESTKPRSLGPHFPSTEGYKVHRCAFAQPSRSWIGGARASNVAVEEDRLCASASICIWNCKIGTASLQPLWEGGRVGLGRHARDVQELGTVLSFDLGGGCIVMVISDHS